MLKRIPFSMSLCALLLCTAAAAEVYEVDPAHSSAEFRIRHLGVSNVSGRFNDIAGTVNFDTEDPSKSSVEIEIQTASIDTAVEARDKHLRSADFFDVEKFPVMTFKSTGFKPAGDNMYEVTGDFTLLGVTRPLTVTVEHIGTGKDQEGNALVGFETTFTIKRSDFGMNTMVGSSLIGDEVKITVAVECKAD